MIILPTMLHNHLTREEERRGGEERKRVDGERKVRRGEEQRGGEEKRRSGEERMGGEEKRRSQEDESRALGGWAGLPGLGRLT